MFIQNKLWTLSQEELMRRRRIFTTIHKVTVALTFLIAPLGMLEVQPFEILTPIIIFLWLPTSILSMEVESWIGPEESDYMKLVYKNGKKKAVTR